MRKGRFGPPHDSCPLGAAECATAAFGGVFNSEMPEHESKKYLRILFRYTVLFNSY